MGILIFLLIILLVVALILDNIALILPYLIIFFIIRYTIKNFDKIKRTFMNIYNESKCSICSDKLILNSGIALKDGKICTKCSYKLSPWFDNYSNSSVQEIKNQIDYRENLMEEPFNGKELYAGFNNKDPKILVDNDSKKLMIKIYNSIEIIALKEVGLCNFKIDSGKYIDKKVTSEDIGLANGMVNRKGLTLDEKRYYQKIIDSGKVYRHFEGELELNKYDYMTTDNWSDNKESWQENAYNGPLGVLRPWYDFYLTINVNNKYINKVSLKLNSRKIYSSFEKNHRENPEGVDGYLDYKSEGLKLCEVISKG